MIRILYCIFKSLNPCNQKVYTPVSIFKLIWENEKKCHFALQKVNVFPERFVFRVWNIPFLRSPWCRLSIYYIILTLFWTGKKWQNLKRVSLTFLSQNLSVFQCIGERSVIWRVLRSWLRSPVKRVKKLLRPQFLWYILEL